MSQPTITPAAPTTAAPRNGFGVTALVLGIVGVVFSWVPVLGGILAILALVFGALGYSRARKGEATNSGMAIAGLILGAIAFVIQVIVFAAVGSAVNQADRDLRGIGSQGAPLAVNQEASSTPALAPLPEPSQFDIKVKILRKQCFGSAGCNVTYQVDPAYTGTAPLPQRTMTVVYEVSGGESGPATNNFTIDGDGKASYPTQEFASTGSSKAALAAKAVSVSDN